MRGLIMKDMLTIANQAKPSTRLENTRAIGRISSGKTTFFT